MGRKIIKISIPFFLIIILGIGCNKDEKKCQTAPVIGSENDITGDWKLVKGQTVFYNPHTIDYSCNRIIYSFSSDGILTIKSDVNNPIGYNSGNYDYIFSLEKLYEHLKEQYTLKIEASYWACGIFGSQMILNSSPVDGSILYFIRIK